MSVRIGLGFRIAPHVRAYVSAPLGGHARRLAGHQGHAEQPDEHIRLNDYQQGIKQVIATLLEMAAV